MDISTAGALSLYNYQTALQGTSTSQTSTSQASAVYQALTSAYADETDFSTGDGLTDAAGTSSLASLVGGIYSAAAASGNTSAIASLSSSLTTAVGGTDASAASSLVSSLGTDGLQGISPDALSLNSTLALAAYSDAQNGLTSGTLTALATSLSASTDPGDSTSVQSAVQASQASATAGTLNLLA
jgi:hypothetical protein